jgi:hypothetical protein
MAHHRRQLAGFMLALALVPSGARAQTVAPPVEPDRWPIGEEHLREETQPKPLMAPVATARDSVWNGALIGAGIGAGFAMWDYLIDPSEPGNTAIFAAGIGLGAAIGAGIDALLNKRGVVRASPRHPARATVSPLLRKDQQGMLVSIRL